MSSIQNRELLCEFSSHRNIDLNKAEVAALWQNLPGYFSVIMLIGQILIQAEFTNLFQALL